MKTSTSTNRSGQPVLCAVCCSVLLLLGGAGCGESASHTDPDGGASDDASGIDAGTTTDGEVSQDGGTTPDAWVPDGLRPVLSNFRVEDAHPDRVYFDSSEPITATTFAGFIVSGKPVSAVHAEPDANTGHYFTVETDFTFWDNNTIRYEGGSDLQDLEGNALYDLALQYVDNLIAEPAATAQTYFVHAAVASSGDGLSEATAFKTLSEAAAIVAAGSTVHVKAGNYGNETVIFLNDGTATQPIVIKGYKQVPGDLDGVMYYTYAFGNAPDPTEMPLWDGGGTTIDHGITVHADYTILRNLQVANYRRLFFSTEVVTGVVFDNCLGHTTTGTGFGSTAFKIRVAGSSKCRIINSIAVNAATENIFYTGNHGLIENCQSYGDTNQASGTDYYFSVRGNHNILRDSTAHREDLSSHSGHGLSVKASGEPTEYNLVENCTTHNIYMAIEARHHEVRHGVFRNIECTKDLAYDFKQNGGIWITSGASYNLFDRIRVYDAEHAIRFHATSEDANADAAGHHNVIRNSLFVNSHYAITNGDDILGLGRIEHDNEIVGCTFHQSGYMFLQSSADPGHGNRLLNCIVSGTQTSEQVASNTVGWVYEHSAFHDNQDFPTPPGSGNVAADPAYTDAPGGDFTLSAATPSAISAGGVESPNNRYDHDQTERIAPYCMGAYELN